MDRIKSALFLDFDSIFGGLHSQDAQSACDFAENSGKWLNTLSTYKLPEGAQRRDLLIRRVYLNPDGGVKYEENGKKKWLSFRRFGPKLIQSGFEVVSCFSLTNRKNAADIRIVIDVLQSMNRITLYDEFIIASSDSDFTPLLQCLRANGRRTMIISSKKTAPAYHNASDALINAADSVDIPTIAPKKENDSSSTSPNKTQKTEEEESSAKNESAPTTEPPSKPPATDAQSKVLETARELIAKNKNSTSLGDISRELRNQFGQEIEQAPGKWFGCSTLSKFLLQNIAGLKQDGSLVWITNKSQNPKNHAEGLPETDSKSSAENLPEIVAQICQITDLPRLSADHWAETLKMLANYTENHESEFKRPNKWVRDQLKEKRIPVSRTAIVRIIKCLKHSGASVLDADPPPTADQIREAVIQNAIVRASEANLDLTPEKQEELRRWLQGKGNSS